MFGEQKQGYLKKFSNEVKIFSFFFSDGEREIV